jgi:hypothetical protein
MVHIPASKYIVKATDVEMKQIPEYNQTKRRHTLIKDNVPAPAGRDSRKIFVISGYSQARSLEWKLEHWEVHRQVFQSRSLQRRKFSGEFAIMAALK